MRNESQVTKPWLSFFLMPCPFTTQSGLHPRKYVLLGEPQNLEGSESPVNIFSLINH